MKDYYRNLGTSEDANKRGEFLVAACSRGLDFDLLA